MSLFPDDVTPEHLAAIIKAIYSEQFAAEASADRVVAAPAIRRRFLAATAEALGRTMNDDLEELLLTKLVNLRRRGEVKMKDEELV